MPRGLTLTHLLSKKLNVNELRVKRALKEARMEMPGRLTHLLSRKLKVNESRVKKVIKEARIEMSGGGKKETMVEYVKRMLLDNKDKVGKPKERVKEVGKE